MITVLLVDDHAKVRKGLRYLLETTEDIQVIATATNGAEAVASVRKRCPDVAVVDISMPVMDGLEATRQIRQLCLMTRVLMLSILDNPEYIQRAVEVGARGFVLKETVGEDLLAAIRTLQQGGRYFCRQVAEIAEKFLKQKRDDSWAG